ncbi:permease DsdX [Acidisoma cellulosilytica]|uniref:Permease DsdX n=1 Tax=Acidisoma cellulosilyticum TaxID=2802395 RepID=A0A963Z069_9PROT|nr:gluconate:H+ symporter [Acidisoma cellulosilyticum]MCB8880378.1 permease DsdX [Acidisoma cellulosilyticum]
MPPAYAVGLAVIAVLALIILIARFKLNPFIVIFVVSLAMALAAGMPADKVVKSFETGVGNSLGHIAIIIALGTMLGKMLAESGGAAQIANTLIRWFGPNNVHWAMLFIGILVGLPVFFEVGFVLLIPIAFNVAKNTGRPLLLVALPLVAGLSAVHGLMPPHPAAMLALQAFHADIGKTILLALIVGIPAAILAGPVYAMFIGPRTPLPAENPLAEQFLNHIPDAQLPGFGITLLTVLLPVILMLLGSFADVFTSPGSGLFILLNFIGNADISLLLAVILSFYTLGLMRGMTRETILKFTNDCLAPTAMITLLIGAGGGFGRVLIDSGVSHAIVTVALSAHVSLLLLAWLLAAVVRLAVGSSTVAMITSAGIVAPIAAHAPDANTALLVLATGAGSLIFSHVNDGGFWLVKQYLNMTVEQTLKSWSVLETILSVGALAMVLILSAVGA